MGHRHDRLRAAREVPALAGGPDAGDAALDGAGAIHVALSAIDRLEVRGRDSAGLHLLVTGHGIYLPDLQIARRSADPLFRSGSVRLVPDAGGDGHEGRPALAFVYKAAAEIGELGDNVRAVRPPSPPTISSVGPAPRGRGHGRRPHPLGQRRLIREPNAHPLNTEEGPAPAPYVVAALNGDVDNHPELGPPRAWPRRPRSPPTPRSSPWSSPGMTTGWAPGGGLPRNRPVLRGVGGHRRQGGRHRRAANSPSGSGQSL